MKRRLLSLLLVMAMLLSMVPFQAFAEEVDEAPRPAGGGDRLRTD